MIRYKVTSRNRKSCLINPRSRFCLDYPKDKIVTADPQTPGIFTHNTETNAKMSKAEGQLILKVKPIGKGTIPKSVSWDMTQRGLIRFFKNLLSKDTMTPPQSTICYPAVKVLD